MRRSCRLWTSDFRWRWTWSLAKFHVARAEELVREIEAHRLVHVLSHVSWCQLAREFNDAVKPSNL